MKKIKPDGLKSKERKKSRAVWKVFELEFMRNTAGISIVTLTLMIEVRS